MALEQLPAGSQRDRRGRGDGGGGDSSGGLFGMAGKLVGQAARTSYDLAKRLPGAEAAERELHKLEQVALTELGKRLDDVTDPYLAPLRRPSASHGDGYGTAGHAPGGGYRGAALPTGSEGELEPLRAAMAELLNRSIGYTESEALEYLYAVVLRQLTPDEARMVSALSDGSPFPVVHVAERSGVSGTGNTVLRNMSSLGKAAGVTLPELVPHYVTRLCSLDLAELTDESPALQTQYEILLAEEEVRTALEATKRPKVTRNTIRLSRFGSRFWQACDPTGCPNTVERR